MKLINEVSADCLEKLKCKAVEDFKEQKREKGFDYLKAMAFCFVTALICTGALVWLIENIDFLPVYEVLIILLEFIIACLMFSGVWCAKDAKHNICDSKKTLTEDEKTDIFEHDSYIYFFNEDLNKYELLKNAEILDVQETNGKVLILYIEKDDIVEKMIVNSKVKVKRGIDEPVLILTDNGFVFHKPYIVEDNRLLSNI